MRTFTSGEVYKLTGVSTALQHEWVQRLKLLAPVSGGTQMGDHRRFDIMAVFAFFAGGKWKGANAGGERYHGVVKLLASMPPERLEAELAAGNTWPVPATLLGELVGEAPGQRCWPGMLVNPATLGDLTPRMAEVIRRLDLKALWDELHRELDKPVPPPKKRGRPKKTAKKRAK
jgi:hypothetical protein